MTYQDCVHKQCIHYHFYYKIIIQYIDLHKMFVKWEHVICSLTCPTQSFPTHGYP